MHYFMHFCFLFEKSFIFFVFFDSPVGEKQPKITCIFFENMHDTILDGIIQGMGACYNRDNTKKE